VEEVFPDLVKDIKVPSTSKAPSEEPETFKGISYTGPIPTPVVAIQEQQATLEAPNKGIEQSENGKRW